MASLTCQFNQALKKMTVVYFLVLCWHLSGWRVKWGCTPVKTGIWIEYVPNASPERYRAIRVFWITIALRFPKQHYLLQGSRASPAFALLVRAACKWRFVWSTDAMIMREGKGRGSEVLREKRVHVPLFPPQISHRLIRDRTRAFGDIPVTNRWDVAQPTKDWYCYALYLLIHFLPYSEHVMSRL